jgi:hypothetical protein
VPAPYRVAFALPVVLLALGARGADDGVPDAPRQPVPPRSIKQIVEFYVENDALGVRTSLAPTNGLTPIAVSDLRGSVRVDVTLRSRRDSPGGSLFFKLMHSSAAENGNADGKSDRSTDTNLFVRPGYFQLSRVCRDGDELWTAGLTQSGDFGKAAAPLADRDDRVSLRVRRQSVSTGVVTEDLARSAPSFVELLRRYPHEAAQHLGPVFRDFGQESSVVGADGRVAWQVLSRRLPREPRLVPVVQNLVAQLDAGDYRTREAALARLRELGGPAALVLSDLPRARYSAEQNSGIETILSDYRPLTEDVAAERLNDPEFLLSCLAYSDDTNIRAAAADRLGELTGRPLPAPPENRDERLKMVQEIRRMIETRPKTAPRSP